jgi:hypothetical protein
MTTKTFKSSKEQYIQLQKDVDAQYIDLINSRRCERILPLVEDMEVDENNDITFTLDEVILDLPDFKQFEERLVNI